MCECNMLNVVGKLYSKVYIKFRFFNVFIWFHIFKLFYNYQMSRS